MEYPNDQFLGLFFILFINDMPPILIDAVNINLNLYVCINRQYIYILVIDMYQILIVYSLSNCT